MLWNIMSSLLRPQPALDVMAGYTGPTAGLGCESR